MERAVSLHPHNLPRNNAILPKQHHGTAETLAPHLRRRQKKRKTPPLNQTVILVGCYSQIKIVPTSVLERREERKEG